MGFSYLLNTNANIESFKTRFNIPSDVNILYCHKDYIEYQRFPHVVLFPLMSILEGEVRFPIDPFYLELSIFTGLALTNVYPTFIG